MCNTIELLHLRYCFQSDLKDPFKIEKQLLSSPQLYFIEAEWRIYVSVI